MTETSFLINVVLLGFIVTLALATDVSCNDVSNRAPQHVSVSVGRESSSMIVSWWTKDRPDHIQLRWGPTAEVYTKATKECDYSTYTTTEAESAGYFMHCEIKDLQRNEEVHYAITLRYDIPDSRSVARCAKIGDFVIADPSLSRRSCLAITAQGGGTRAASAVINSLDFIKHQLVGVLWPGGLAMAGIPKHWDLWQDRLSPVSAAVPFFFAPGATELQEDNGKATPYRNRIVQLGNYNMSEGADAHHRNLYYSVKYGPFQIIALDSSISLDEKSPQYEFLLRETWFADKFDERVKRPWLIIMLSENVLDKDSLSESFRKSLLSLANSRKVDFVISGSPRYYARSHPLDVNEKAIEPTRGSLAQPYRGNATTRGVTFVTVGTGGAARGVNDEWTSSSSEIAYHSDDSFGYAKLCVDDDAQALSWEFIPVSEKLNENDGPATWPRDRAFYCRGDTDLQCPSIHDVCELVVPNGHNEWMYRVMEPTGGNWTMGYTGNLVRAPIPKLEGTAKTAWGVTTTPIGYDTQNMEHVSVSTSLDTEKPNRVWFRHTFEITEEQFQNTNELEIWINAHSMADVWFNGRLIDDEFTRGQTHMTVVEWRRMVVVPKAKMGMDVVQALQKQHKLPRGVLAVGTNMIAAEVHCGSTKSPCEDGSLLFDAEVRLNTNNHTKAGVACSVPPTEKVMPTTRMAVMTQKTTKAPPTTSEGAVVESSTQAPLDGSSNPSGPSVFLMFMILLLGIVVCCAWYAYKRKRAKQPDAAKNKGVRREGASGGARRQRFVELDEEDDNV